MSIFRELFVEVPISLLEAAVREAGARTRPVPTPAIRFGMACPDVFMPLVRDVQDRFGWEAIDWLRDSGDMTITVRVRMKCHHIGRVVLDERKLFETSYNSRDFVDYVLDALATEPIRKCKCGEPQGLGPAGRAQ